MGAGRCRGSCSATSGVQLREPSPHCPPTGPLQACSLPHPPAGWPRGRVSTPTVSSPPGHGHLPKPALHLFVCDTFVTSSLDFIHICFSFNTWKPSWLRLRGQMLTSAAPVPTPQALLTRPCRPLRMPPRGAPSLSRSAAEDQLRGWVLASRPPRHGWLAPGRSHSQPVRPPHAWVPGPLPH